MLPADLVIHEIPSSRYLIFTTGPGTLPDIIIKAWQEIWHFFEANNEYRRAFVGDFERYDERAQDPNNAVVDIYISIT